MYRKEQVIIGTDGKPYFIEVTERKLEKCKIVYQLNTSRNKIDIDQTKYENDEKVEDDDYVKKDKVVGEVIVYTTTEGNN